MAWTGRRRGWLSIRSPSRRLPVTIPDVPMFSPAVVAHVLHVYPSNVTYWVQTGKLDVIRDGIGKPYILRAELVRFVREYIGKEVD